MKYAFYIFIGCITLAVIGLIVFVPNEKENLGVVKNPYIDKGTHFELPITVDTPQGERVEIHKDKAQMDLIGWNDEYKISIIPQIPSTLFGATQKDFKVQANRPRLSKRMEYKQGNVTAFIEPKSENEFDIDFTLESKPDTNVFEYRIEGAEEFDFFYQPELTPEEIADGNSRPENVVGSYAVYHKTKRDNCTNCEHALYQTGKVAHIYRPKAIDANGAEEWAVLSYGNGVLSVEVPQKFLDDAVYPVRVDPTFGYHTVGASIFSGSVVDSMRLNDDLVLENGTVNSISIFSLNFASNIKGVLVASTTLTIVTNGVTDPVLVSTGAGGDWATSTYSAAPSIVSGTRYFIGFINESDLSFSLRFDTVNDFNRVNDNSNSYATPIDPTDGVITASRRHSYYATYTAAAGAVDTPNATMILQNGTATLLNGRIIIP